MRFSTRSNEGFGYWVEVPDEMESLVVVGVEPDVMPKQVSRTNVPAAGVASSVRLVALESNAT